MSHLRGVAIAVIVTVLLAVIECHSNVDECQMSGASLRPNASSNMTDHVSRGPPYFVEYPNEYYFIVDEPQQCQLLEPFVVVIIPVNPHDRASRDRIRRTWGLLGNTQLGCVLGQRMSLFFLLGLPTGQRAEQVQQEVLKESGAYRDLLQSNFADTYNNLTIKTMVMMEWLDSRCPMASYAMKIDTDRFLNVHNLVDMLLNAPKNSYMTGLVVHRGKVIRDQDSKWFLPCDAFPASHYPPYAGGPGYVFSLDMPRKLLEASRHVEAVYLEDVYLGLCMEYLGIPFSYIPFQSRNLLHEWPMNGMNGPRHNVSQSSDL